MRFPNCRHQTSTSRDVVMHLALGGGWPVTRTGEVKLKLFYLPIRGLVGTRSRLCTRSRLRTAASHHRDIPTTTITPTRKSLPTEGEFRL